MVQDKTGRR